MKIDKIIDRYVSQNLGLKIIKNPNYPSVGRCVHCDARDYCGHIMMCQCDLTEHYIDIRKHRKLKLQKLNEEIKKM